MITDHSLSPSFRFLKSFHDFLYFWYIKSSRDFWRSEIAFLKRVENDIGLLVNLKLITQPIYGDYSYMGKVIGPIFRLGRVLFGSAAVLFSFLAIVVCYILWLALPVVAVIMVWKNLMYILFE